MLRRSGGKRQQRQQPPLTSFPLSPPSQSQPSSPPPLPTKSLFDLLNLNPHNDEDRSKYDDRAVIKQVRRNPNDAKTTHAFSAYYNIECYPLWMAVMLGCSLEAAKALYEANPQAIEHTDEFGNTVLHWACHFKVSLNVATFLVEKNPSSLEMKTNYGYTPLHYACINGAPLEVVEMLLGRYPPALHIKDNYGDTPLVYAKEEDASPEVIALLEKAEATAASSSSSSPVKPAAAASSITTSSATPSASDQEKQTKSSSSPQDSLTNSKVASLPAEPMSSTASSQEKQTKSDSQTAEFDDETSTIAAEDVDIVTLTPSELAAVKAITSNMQDFETYFASTATTLTTQEQEAVEILAANLEEFNRSLESVRGLPRTLASKPDHVKEYFQIFTSGFERTYVAALTLSSGAVKGQLMSTNRQITACVLEALGSITSDSNIPFLGLIAIFTSLGTHMLQQQESNMLRVFQDFFSGQSRDEYLLTYRAAAEQICLQPDYLSSYSDASPDVSPLRTKVKKAIERVQKRLQRCHLQAISNLQPIELKAMDDLSTLTECVLEQWMDNRDEYDQLKQANTDKKSAFILNALGIQRPTWDEPASLGGQGSEGVVRQGSAAQPDQWRARNDSEAEIIGLLQEKLQHMEEQQEQHSVLVQRLEKENREKSTRMKDLEEKFKQHLGDESVDVDVGGGGGAQMMSLISKQAKVNARTNARKGGETTAGFDASEVMDKVCDIEHELYKVAHMTKKNTLDNFVANRVMTVPEATLLVEKILLRSSDDLQGKGQIKHHSSIAVDSKGCFTLSWRRCQIGKFHGRSSSWKRNMQVKIDQDHNGAKSVKSWFEEYGLGYRYELHHKVVIQGMFADELE